MGKLKVEISKALTSVNSRRLARRHVGAFTTTSCSSGYTSGRSSTDYTTSDSSRAFSTTSHSSRSPLSSHSSRLTTPSGACRFFASESPINSAWKKCSSFLANLSNPVVGDRLMKLQRPGLYYRIDGRSFRELYEQGGLPQRVATEMLMILRATEIEQYQKYNNNPFAWGSCSSLKDLHDFMQGNLSQSARSSVHVFRGSASSLNAFKIDANIESQGLDSEREHLVLTSVSPDQFIASTSPKYRNKFMANELVPNAVYEINKDVPKSMRQSDIASAESTLAWLMTHNCEDEFRRLSLQYVNLSQETLTKRFQDSDTALLRAVQAVIESQYTSSLGAP